MTEKKNQNVKMYLSNNSRKLAGLSMHRKKNAKSGFIPDVKVWRQSLRFFSIANLKGSRSTVRKYHVVYAMTRKMSREENKMLTEREKNVLSPMRRPCWITELLRCWISKGRILRITRSGSFLRKTIAVFILPGIWGL